MKRAQAVLWFSEGMRVEAIAQQLRSTRQSIYNWIDRIDQGRGSSEQRLKDAPRPGRPADKRQLAAQVIPDLLEVSPQDKGYRATGWTNRHIVQTVVKQAGYRWKRPRYVLSRRSQHWRQSKGGSSAA